MNEVAQLEAAIRAQESLRSSLGDAVVDATVAALRRQIQQLTTEGARARVSESEALASLRSHLPDELADKARALGSVEGERKQATVVFADLSGFTAVSEQADPELIRAFQRDLFRDLARIIYQHEGFVEKFVGDAILAVFGAPVAHEDDPERALRVALAMRERMAVLNRTWADRLGTSVTLHVGINTGAVVAGKIGSELDSDGGAYAVTGDTVNSAARLQNAAQPGQILVSRTTYRFARGGFTFRALEPIAVKNRHEPLDVYELVRARLLPGKTRGIQELAEAFVGRDAALAQLGTVTDRFTSGESAPIVLITGEAGIGKSRLVEEWRKQTGEQVRWLEGRCFAHTQMLSYSAFLDMLRRYAGIGDDDTDRRARQRLDASVERLFPGDLESRALLANLLAMRLRRDESAFIGRLSARELRDRVFALAHRLFGELAREKPRVIFLEDIQWADLTTLELVQHLANTLPSRFMLVMAGRADADSSLAVLEPKLEPFGERVLKLPLTQLDTASSASMVHALLSSEQLPRPLVSLISDKAEGNPFFVEEVIRQLIERGAIQRQGEAWAVTPLLEKISVPETLQGLIMARIDRLPDETKDVVQHAAVIGRTFLYRVLLAISGASPTLDADLTHLERNDLILENVRDAEVEYTFRHALTQETAYQSLLTSRRRDLHLRVAEAMERIFAGRVPEYYSILGTHFLKGEQWAKASTYFLKAADQASQQMTLEARQHYEETLSAIAQINGKLAPEDLRTRIDAVIGWCRNVIIGGGTFSPDDIARCLELLSVADADAGTLLKLKYASKDDRMRAARVIAWTAQAKSMGGRADETIPEYVERIRNLDVNLDAELAARLGQVLVHRGHFREAVTMLTPAVKELDSARPDQPEWVHANGALAVAEAGSGQFEAGLKRAQAGVSRVERLRKLALRGPAATYVGAVHLLGGDWQSVESIHEPQRANLENMPLSAQGIFDTLECGTHSLRREPNADQIARMNAIIGNAATDGQHQHTPPKLQPILTAWHEAFEAGVALQLQQFDAAESHAISAQQLAGERDDAFGGGVALRMLALARAGNGAEADQVDQLLSESEKMLSEAGCVLEAARTERIWGEILLTRKDDRNAKLRFAKALRTFDQPGLELEANSIRSVIATMP